MRRTPYFAQDQQDSGGAQTRYWNWKADDLTASLNRWLLGILEPGVYRGFDFAPAAGMVLKMAQTTTALLQTRKDGAQKRTGVIVTPQGAVVQEDGVISVNISATTAQPRIDLIVCSYQYAEVEGGSPAGYSVVQGVAASVPQVPNVVNSAFDVAVAELYLPANCNTLLNPDVRYTRRINPSLGNRFPLELKNGDEIKLAYEKDLNRLTRSGIYLVTGTDYINAPIAAGDPLDKFVVYVANGGLTGRTQIAIELASNNFYFRGCNTNDGAWRGWINLNDTSLITQLRTDMQTAFTQFNASLLAAFTAALNGLNADITNRLAQVVLNLNTSLQATRTELLAKITALETATKHDRQVLEKWQGGSLDYRVPKGFAAALSDPVHVYPVPAGPTRSYLVHWTVWITRLTTAPEMYFSIYREIPNLPGTYYLDNRTYGVVNFGGDGASMTISVTGMVANAIPGTRILCVIEPRGSAGNQVRLYNSQVVLDGLPDPI